MGINKLNSLMKTMTEKAGLDAKNFTNHSGRKRMIQKLNNQGVPPRHIMQNSEHKDAQSLSSYSTLSERQQSTSNILSGYSSVSGPSGCQGGIFDALTLNPKHSTGVHNTAALDSFPRRFNSGRNF